MKYFIIRTNVDSENPLVLPFDTIDELYDFLMDGDIVAKEIPVIHIPDDE